MIDWVLGIAERLGWPSEAVHSEEFLAPQSAKTITLSQHESLLEVMEREVLDTPSLCHGEACGQCKTRVVTHDRTFQHHDHWLEDDERDSSQIMPCVRRFEGGRLMLVR